MGRLSHYPSPGVVYRAGCTSKESLRSSCGYCVGDVSYPYFCFFVVFFVAFSYDGRTSCVFIWVHGERGNLTVLFVPRSPSPGIYLVYTALLTSVTVPGLFHILLLRRTIVQASVKSAPRCSIGHSMRRYFMTTYQRELSITSNITPTHRTRYQRRMYASRRRRP